ncbi:MAG: alkaline phosphatase D family protein, partial [Planctomycetota bacterium]
DDHDYGANDAGNDFALREESQRAFLDFYGFRENDPIREQEGIYHARAFTGPDGQRVQVIMLDTRYHRDALERGPRSEWGGGRYIPSMDTSKTLLGEAQWSWLEDRLREPADVRVIASSIQVVASEHRYETWGNMPHERQRLYDLIDTTDASGVLIISGDRHLMEISRDASAMPGREVPYPIWDFTSSGMTQRAGSVNEPNAFRVGPVLRETNFGVIRFAWGDTPETTVIHLEGLGDQGQMLTRQTIWLSDLAE